MYASLLYGLRIFKGVYVFYTNRKGKDEVMQCAVLVIKISTNRLVRDFLAVGQK